MSFGGLLMQVRMPNMCARVCVHTHMNTYMHTYMSTCWLFTWCGYVTHPWCRDIWRGGRQCANHILQLYFCSLLASPVCGSEHTCMRICIYVYAYICVCIWSLLAREPSLQFWTYMYAYMYIHVCVYMCVYLKSACSRAQFTVLEMYVGMWICAYVLYLCVCVYTCIYIHINSYLTAAWATSWLVYIHIIYIYIYIYIYIASKQWSMIVYVCVCVISYQTADSAKASLPVGEQASNSLQVYVCVCACDFVPDRSQGKSIPSCEWASNVL